jgi:AmmeMemoRadiSam system protein A
MSVDAESFRSFLKETSATICGRHGLGVLLELIPRIAPQAKPVKLAYWLSIEMPGFSDDNSVSYLSLAYVPGEAPSGAPLELPPRYDPCPADSPPLEPDTGEALVRIARAALRTQMTGTDDLPRELSGLGESGAGFDCLQGVFVTLNRTDPDEIARKGRLRGCIGQIAPAYPLQEAVVIAALQAALEDRRFQPVRAEELPRLSVEVSVLTPSRPVDSWREIEIGKHGIIVRKGNRRAVYLPHVATEQGWDLEETLHHLSRKAGLPADGWREGADFEVFEARVFEEHPSKPGSEAEHGNRQGS